MADGGKWVGGYWVPDKTGTPAPTPSSTTAPTPGVPLGPKAPAPKSLTSGTVQSAIYNSEPRYTSVFDRFWTDDLGGNVKAVADIYVPDDIQKGSFLPRDMRQGYQDNVGDKINAVSTGATVMYDTVNWGVSGVMLAANANYWRNRGKNDNLWQTATEVSAGQAFAAAVSPIQDALGESLGMGKQGIYAGWDDFDIADKYSRDLIFAPGTASSVGSGIADATVSWFLDPLVVVGKGAKVLRFGTEAMGGFTGVSARSTNSIRVAEQIDGALDDALAYASTGGTEGRETFLNVIGRSAAKANDGELREMPWIKTSTQKDAMSGIFNNIDDERTAVLAVAAGTGNQRAIAMLRTEAASVHDAMGSLSRYDAYERAWYQPGYGMFKAPLLDDVLEMNQSGRAILDDLIKRDNALADMLGVLAIEDSPIRMIGGTSNTGMKIAAAWRAGRANRDTVNASKAMRGKEGPLTADATDAKTWMNREPRWAPAMAQERIDRAVAEGRITAARGEEMKRAATGMVEGAERSRTGIPTSAPGVYESVFQLSSNFRKVGVWNWINGQRGSGWLNIRGVDDGASSDEWVASLTDSKVLSRDKGFVRASVAKWNAGRAVVDRMGLAAEIEMDAVTRIATHYGVKPEAALAAYKIVSRARQGSIDMFKAREGHAFAVDDTGKIIALHPQMRSQLETHVPILDFRVMEHTISRMAKPQYRTEVQNHLANVGDIMHMDEARLHSVDLFMEELNSFWKATVLFRLGYPVRNTAEGWLRTAAVLGTIPALAPARVAKGISRTVYTNPRNARRREEIAKFEGVVADHLHNNTLMRNALIEERDAHLNATYTLPLPLARDRHPNMKFMSPDGSGTEVSGWSDEFFDGYGGVGPDRDIIGYVRVSALTDYPGNGTSARKVDYLTQEMASGEGYQQPIWIMFDPETGRYHVGDGNHRLAAAAAVGEEYVPAIVVRSRRKMDDDYIAVMTEGTVGTVKGRKPPTSPDGKDEWPSRFNPAYIFGKKDIAPTERQFKTGFAGRTGRNPLGTRLSPQDGQFPGNHPHDPDWFPVAHMGQKPQYESEVMGYAEKYGIDISGPTPDFDAVRVDPDRMHAIGDEYDAMPSLSDDPAVASAYGAMARQTEDQYRYLTEDLGIRVEVVRKNPYDSPAKMAEDIEKNGVLKVLSTNETGAHPYLSNAQNDMFRAVHDYFGHYLTGRGFDRHGEEAAWVSHSRMFDTEARQAMTVETRGQNSFVNTRGYFGEQKLGLMDPKWSEVPDYGTLTPDPIFDALKAQLDEVDAAGAALRDVAGQLSAAKRAAAKKFIGSEPGGAFTGDLGDLRRALANNDATQRNFFSAKGARDVQTQLSDRQWTAVKPTDAQYWGEHNAAVNQLRLDPLAREAIRGRTPEEMSAWLRTPDGKAYASSMGLRFREQRATRVATLHDLVERYLPTDEARALADSEMLPSPDEFRGLLSGRPDLSPVHGRQVAEQMAPTENLYRAITQGIFKWIGNKPDSALVRQPFYNEVWKRETKSLWEKAKAQGYDELDPAEQLAWDKRIEEAAHRRSLKMTNDTLFTLTRYSNPAAVFRFVSPFFAAWENSTRTWLKIIANDPSVLARGMILWDMPNQLGLVVDKDGNRVESDRLGFLTGSENQYVIMPKAINDWVMERNGGVPLKMAKGSFNVVSPGETPALPGFGPAVVAPVGMYLANKPDTQEFLKRALGEKVYNQFAPFGNASGDWLDTVASPAARKAFILWQGQDNADYLAVQASITQSAVADWLLSGGDLRDKPKAEDIAARTDAFWRMSWLSSVTLPVSTTRMSKYQPQIDYWNSLKADPTMSFDEKIAAFEAKYPSERNAYNTFTQSTSRGQSKDVDPTIEAWSAITDNAPQARALSAIDPKALGILGATAATGKFSPGVFQYWLTNTQPGTTSAYKEKALPEDIINEALVSQMWDEYNAEKAQMEAALTRLGVKTWDSKTAQQAGITKMWVEFMQGEDGKGGMLGKYGTAWTVYGPQGFRDDMPIYLSGINTLLNDKSFMSSDLGQSTVWSNIRTYMEEREMAKRARDRVGLSDEQKDAIDEVWAKFQQDHRYSSLGFADFFDSYLAQDDLTVEVPGLEATNGG